MAVLLIVLTAPPRLSYMRLADALVDTVVNEGYGICKLSILTNHTLAR